MMSTVLDNPVVFLAEDALSRENEVDVEDTSEPRTVVWQPPKAGQNIQNNVAQGKNKYISRNDFYPVFSSVLSSVVFVVQTQRASTSSRGICGSCGGNFP